LAFALCGTVTIFFGPIIMAFIMKDPVWVITYCIAWIPGIGFWTIGSAFLEAV